MVFTVNEEKRIICLFAIYESPTEVRRRYINEYYIAPLVIFSDEKWWVLDSSPNSQNERRWSLFNPREYAECKYQGKKKVMCWMGFLQGAVLGPFWFVDEQQRPITLNQFSYLNMLEHDLWPVLRERRNLRRIWFMQDRATCHCTGRVLSWLGTKFNDRIISRRTPIPWPPQSPDLNPLDFWLWGHLVQIHEVLTNSCKL